MKKIVDTDVIVKSIRPIGSIKFEGKGYIVYDDNSKDHTGTFFGKTFDEAEEKVQKSIKEFRTNRDAEKRPE